MYPSVETWFVSNDVEREALSNPLTVTFDEGRIEVGPLELQIAYEFRLARTADSPSGKDFEDALHLYLTFEERFDTEQLEAYVNQLGVEEYYGNLPRPTRSLLPCGGRSLLEGGAFPRRNCTPRPRVVRESDALSSSAHGRRSRPFAWSAELDESRAYHERREASFERHGRGPASSCGSTVEAARRSSAATRAYRTPAVDCPAGLIAGGRLVRPRLQGARPSGLAPQMPVHSRHLPTPTCAGTAVTRETAHEGKTRLPHGESERRRALLTSPPLASLAAEEGGSAPCTAPAEDRLESS